MKPCITCSKSLPLDDFYHHPQMADGHLNKCKECVKAYQRSRPIIVGYEKARAMLPHRVAARKAYSETEDGKAAHRRSQQKQKQMFPKKWVARNKVSNALRDGKIERPAHCSVCANGCKPHAHHDDYDKPLDVRWLCTTCHRQWHKENGTGLNGTS